MGAEEQAPLRAAVQLRVLIKAGNRQSLVKTEDSPNAVLYICLLPALWSAWLCALFAKRKEVL